MEENDPVFRNGGKSDKPRLVLNHDSICANTITLTHQNTKRKHQTQYNSEDVTGVSGENQLTIHIECSVGCDNRTWDA